MKFITRYLPILALATAILLPSPAAADFLEGAFRYTVANGEATITKYEGPGGNVIIPETLGGHTVISIGGGAFQGQTSLTGVTMPDSVISIGKHAFLRCTSLISAKIGNSVSIIREGAFGTTGFSQIAVPASVTTIEDDAFSSIRLEFIEVAEENPVYSSYDGVLFNKTRTLLIFYPLGKGGSYEIPETVTTIGDRAFRNCSTLLFVSIPGSVTTIGRAAFAGCSGLTRVTILDSIASINYAAFEWCTSLTSVYFCGTPPVAGSFVFSNTPAKVYYLPSHAAHWPGTYAGRMTYPWFPSVTQSVRHTATGAFSFSTFWAPSQNVQIKAATRLIDPDWHDLLSTNIPPSGTLEFTDPDAADHSTRFYRIIGP